MNPTKDIYCLSNMMNVKWNDNEIGESSQEEREIAQHLAEIILSFCSRKQFEYEPETTLNFYHDQCEYDGDDGCEEETDVETENDLVEKHPQLENYSIEFMQQVIEFVDEKDESEKCRRTWKYIHHRFRR